MNCSMLGLPLHHQLPESTQTNVHWVRDAIQPSHPLSFPFSSCLLPNISVFSNKSALHIRWPKYWNFSFSISPSNEHSGLISGLILVGSPCSPRDSQEFSPTPHFKSINSSVLSFLVIQLSHPYMTTGASIALTRLRLIMSFAYILLWLVWG